MKKMISLILAMMLLALSVLGLAETGTEAASTEESEPDFFGQSAEWWRNVWDGFIEYNTGVAQFFVYGADVAKDTVLSYVGMAEDYLRNIYPEWDEETKKAWDTIKEAAETGSAEAREQSAEAWGVVKNWMLEAGETMSEGTQALFDAVGSAAGVAEATVSGWVRTVETYLSENADTANEAVREAWETIKAGALEANETVLKQMEDARQILNEWLGEQSDTEAPSVTNAVNGIVEFTTGEGAE